MNNFFTQLKNIARTMRLSQDEKQRMRFTILDYIEQNPIEVRRPVASTVPHSIPSPYLFFSPKFMAPVVLLLIVGLGSGTAFAAQGALPGSPLYAVKVHVNEPVQVALATTPQAKAEVNAHIATTRLEEAETLAANGVLDASTSEALATNFTAHAAAAEQNTSDISQNDPGTAVELGAQFSSTLAAHQAILAQISGDTKGKSGEDNSNAIVLAVRASEHDQDSGDNNNTNGNDNDTEVTLALATATGTEASATSTIAPTARVRMFAAKTNGPRGTATVAPAASSSATTTPTINLEDAKGSARDAAVAQSLQTQASASINRVIHDFGTIQSQLDPGLAAQAQAQIAAAQKAFARGSASLAAGDMSAAKNQFSSVIRMTVKLDTYLTVGRKINIKLLPGLLNLSTGDKRQDGDSGSNSGSGDSGSNSGLSDGSGGDH